LGSDKFRADGNNKRHDRASVNVIEDICLSSFMTRSAASIAIRSAREFFIVTNLPHRVISFDGRTSFWLSVRRFALPSVIYFTLPEIFLTSKMPRFVRGFVSALTQVDADHQCQEGVTLKYMTRALLCYQLDKTCPYPEGNSGWITRHLTNVVFIGVD
jgi:hypothetical protein